MGIISSSIWATGRLASAGVRAAGGVTSAAIQASESSAARNQVLNLAAVTVAVERRLAFLKWAAENPGWREAYPNYTPPPKPDLGPYSRLAWAVWQTALLPAQDDC